MANIEETASLSQLLTLAAKLLREDPGLAENRIREILRVYPNEPNALNLLGACQRLTGQTELSLKTLQQVVSKQQDGFATEADAQAWGETELKSFLHQLEQRNKRRALLRK